jgi:sodium transport system permease protein
MSWRNVQLIYGREIRDQLRDRRTLFMIAVLPLLLYPLLGMSVFQLSQFVRKSEPKILVLGSEQLAGGRDLPPLFADGQFSSTLLPDPDDAGRLHLEFAARNGESSDASDSPMRSAQLRLKGGEIQVVLEFPDDFGERLHELRNQIEARPTDEPPVEEARDAIEVPEPQLLYNSGKEKSRVAHRQVEQILNTWKSQIIRDNLLASRIPMDLARPFELKPHDVAERRQQQALVWSKILPFVLFIWALTGAFYPAVDLCAGEKERGTLETLLSSPALRTEIVWGKLLTVMTFSTATALLNLVSLGFTARYVISQLRLLPGSSLGESLDLPPLASAAWLLVALVPMSALFSASCLACAAFARSTKEGQYYLMPLLLVTMPLMMLPLAPGAELNLGNSLIPVTGVVLLLMGLVQGNYAEVLRYVVPVCLVTLVCCHGAIRWAVYQFNHESVLFRESERLDLRRWLIHLVRDRRETPTLAEAFFCVAMIFVLQFFTQIAISANAPATLDFRFFALLLFVSQAVCIAMPALLMATLLTARPLKSLLLDRPPNVAACGVAVLLAVILHPVGLQLSHVVRQIYPVQQNSLLNDAFAQMFATAPYAWLPYVLLAALPAFCEEVAFRGFILSGLRHLGSKWWAIGLSAVFFGMAHTVVQQSLTAAALGLVIGYVAVQTGSLVPCILFHLTYNALMFASLQLPDVAARWPAIAKLVQQPEGGHILYEWPIVVACGLAAVIAIRWLNRLPYLATQEEQLSDVRSRQAQQQLAAGAE